MPVLFEPGARGLGRPRASADATSPFAISQKKSIVKTRGEGIRLKEQRRTEGIRLKEQRRTEGIRLKEQRRTEGIRLKE